MKQFEFIIIIIWINLCIGIGCPIMFQDIYEHFLIMKIMMILNHIDFNVHFYLTNQEK